MNSYRKRGKEHPLIVLKAHFLMFKLAPICYSDSFTPFKIIQMEYQLIFRVLTIYWIMVLIASYVWHHWISLKNSQDRYYYFHITDEDIRTHQGRHTTKGYGVSIWGRKDINLIAWLLNSHSYRAMQVMMIIIELTLAIKSQMFSVCRAKFYTTFIILIIFFNLIHKPSRYSWGDQVIVQLHILSPQMVSGCGFEPRNCNYKIPVLMYSTLHIILCSCGLHVPCHYFALVWSNSILLSFF